MYVQGTIYDWNLTENSVKCVPDEDLVETDILNDNDS